MYRKEALSRSVSFRKSQYSYSVHLNFKRFSKEIIVVLVRFSLTVYQQENAAESNIKLELWLTKFKKLIQIIYKHFKLYKKKHYFQQIENRQW